VQIFYFWRRGYVLQKVHSVLAPGRTISLQWTPEEFRFKDKCSTDVQSLRANDQLFFRGLVTPLLSSQNKQKRHIYRRHFPKWLSNNLLEKHKCRLKIQVDHKNSFLSHSVSNHQTLARFTFLIHSEYYQSLCNPSQSKSCFVTLALRL
jgi:hypothetical protein